MTDPSTLRRKAVSVEADWFGQLPTAHLNVFQRLSSQSEALYLAFSVALDESISLRDQGFVEKATQVLALASELCCRTCGCTGKILSTMGEQCGTGGIIPSAAPLDSNNFSSPMARNRAMRNRLLDHIPGSRRLRFHRKTKTLKELIARLTEAFRQRVVDLQDRGDRRSPVVLWAALDSIHYDLNTCLRELLVMLKCFLRACSEEDLNQFQRSLVAEWRTRSPLLPKAHSVLPAKA